MSDVDKKSLRGEFKRIYGGCDKVLRDIAAGEQDGTEVAICDGGAALKEDRRL